MYPVFLPCRGRSQPVGCYSVEFAFLNFYKNAAAEQPTERVYLLNVGPLSRPSKQKEEFGKENNEHDIGKLTDNSNHLRIIQVENHSRRSVLENLNRQPVIIH